MDKVIETPFQIGALYWMPVLNPRQIEMPCPVCYGNRTITVTLGNGEHVAVECEGCGIGYDGPRGFVTDYSYEYAANPFTIEVVTSMYGGSWRLKSIEGDNADWSTLCATEQEALDASKKRMQEVIDANTDTRRVKKNHAVKQSGWSVGYHEKQIKEYERKIAWHRGKVSERTQHPQPRGEDVK